MKRRQPQQDLSQAPFQGYPSHELIKPTCTCGLELCQIYYSVAAKPSFLEFSAAFGVSAAVVAAMEFQDPPEFPAEKDKPTLNDPLEGMKLCCLKTLRTGGTYSISLFQTDSDGTAKSKSTGLLQRKYPEALPEPFSAQETLYWAT